ncbi:hypothetical protein F1728_19510 [Gimesia benthica]|uniref:Oxidoreductase FAD/NAD(P)-binding domain-containing protein n=3 Tax=Gimesia TaxID=1649453 RepID=A0A6I6AH61_9PLAN|nr:hypothetical protein F1728_19510 [Gimesia benthica]HCO23925.1 hypothetical protein [Gimesia maris]
MSMLRHMRDTGSQRPVTLLFANKTESDIVFHDELAKMQAAQQPPLRVVHIISRPDESCTKERGHIDVEKLDRWLGDDLTGKGYYICGPASLTKQVAKALRQCKVPQDRMHAESFSLLEDTAPVTWRSVQRSWATVVMVCVTLVLVVVAAVMRADGTTSPDDHGEHSPAKSAHSHSNHE